MQSVDGELLLSASDLARHLGCGHLTNLDRGEALGELAPPVWKDPALEVLEQRGFEHEEAYVRWLRAQELRVADLREEDDLRSALERTRAAMAGGADVIVQATLRSGRWHGRADILRRADRPSKLGAFSYEVVDTKLARETRAGTVLQLCLYSDLVGELQGLLPEKMFVVPPVPEFAAEELRVSDYLAYYQFVRRRLEGRVGATLAETYPEPVPQCDVCRWWPACRDRRRDDDHLSLVAGLQRLHARELAEHGITTLAALAREPLPFRRPKRGTLPTYERLKAQAAVQLAGRERGAPYHELIEVEDKRGLCRLPEPSSGDVFFDIEGDPFAGDGGLEYLFGWATAGAGTPEYHGIWSLDRGSERDMFVRFVDMVMERWRRFPDMHVYHYAPYEPSALKRLMSRYATREDQVDRMLRAGLLVDLHGVVRQGVRASVERYSIKDLEPHFGYERDAELRAANAARIGLEHALELGTIESIAAEERKLVEDYNRDDCVSALRLRDWLEDLRASLVARGASVPRPTPESGDPSDRLAERQAGVQALYERLLDGVPAETAERNATQHGRWLMAQMLDYHRREDKVVWWEYFRMRDLAEEDLLDERKALAGLELVGPVEVEAFRVPVHRYRFPPQECALKSGSKLHDLGGDKIGEVHAIDRDARTIDVKKKKKTADRHATALFAHDFIPSDVHKASLFRLATAVADGSLDELGAAGDLLLARAPRLSAAPAGRLRRDDEDVVGAGRRLALDLDHSVLAVQGPPGSGKTWAGARMIVALVAAGRKVGITAVSHKVIRKLLDDVIAAAAETGATVRCMQKVKEESDDPVPGLTETKDNKDVRAALDAGHCDVAAGTTWLWAREDMAGAVDILVIDEAGQLSLADALAVAPATDNLILLGDPQQLEQPQQGAHPEGADIAALEHMLQGERTISEERGLFLDKTWRLHPKICEFTSELFYENRLASRPELARQVVSGPTPLAGSGLRYVPVEHTGNQTDAPEEVAAVERIVASLTQKGVTCADKHGNTVPVTKDHILIVAPFNAQVTALKEALPDARAGTVDKFQGQEAPVVIYSLTTSTPDEAPRGMEFLYNLSRLNVATSRARCICVLAGNPALFAPECRSPAQMRLANGLCRYREMAEVVALSALA